MDPNTLDVQTAGLWGGIGMALLAFLQWRFPWLADLLKQKSVTPQPTPVTPAPAPVVPVPVPVPAGPLIDRPALQRLLQVAQLIALVTPNKLDDLLAAAAARMLADHSADLAETTRKRFET